MFIHFRTKWAKVNGQIYRSPCAVVLGVEEDYPLFAEFNNVFVLDRTRVVAHVNMLTTTHFNTHYHTYVIERTATTRVVVLDTLLNPFSLHIRKVANFTHVIVVKHHIAGTLQS